MDGAPALTRFQPVEGANGLGLETVDAGVAAFAKAASGALLSSGGNAFSTRTASFIVQEHFPPGIDFTGGGPLFGVQFSSLACSDVNRVSPLGLAADPGGFPLYKNGRVVGGIGVEGDGALLARSPARPRGRPARGAGGAGRPARLRAAGDHPRRPHPRRRHPPRLHRHGRGGGGDRAPGADRGRSARRRPVSAHGRRPWAEWPGRPTRASRRARARCSPPPTSTRS